MDSSVPTYTSLALTNGLAELMQSSTDDLLYAADQDPDFSDADSAYEGSLRSVGDTLKSSAYDFTFENGRRYHNYREGRYPLPNDDKEQERLDLSHRLFGLLHRGHLFRAPLVNPKRVLDLGCGTGMWCLEFGDQFPDCEVIGTDLSPIQPSWKPPNVTFIVDDFEDTWTWEKPFEFIHARTLAGSVKSWEGLISNIHQNLVPGGWCQIIETQLLDVFSDDGTYPANGAHARYNAKLREAITKAEIEVDIPNRLKGMLRDQGFVDVRELRQKTPTNDWPRNPHMKELGKISAEILKTGLEAYGLAFLTRILGMESDEAMDMIHGAVAELTDRRVHAYFVQYTVFGRKAYDGEYVEEPSRKRTKRSDSDSQPGPAPKKEK